MAALVRDSRAAMVVWAALMVATVLSVVLGIEGGGEAGDGAHPATVAVIFIAFIKIRFIGRHFMELNEAPLALKFVFDAYVVVISTALAVIYLVTS